MRSDIRSFSSFARGKAPKNRLSFDLSLYLVTNGPSFQDKELFLKKIEPVYEGLRFNDGVAMAGGLMDETNPDVTVRKILSIRQKNLQKIS